MSCFSCNKNKQLTIYMNKPPRAMKRDFKEDLLPIPKWLLHHADVVGHRTHVVHVVPFDVVDEATELERHLAVKSAHPVAAQSQLAESRVLSAPRDASHDAPGRVEERLAPNAVVPASEELSHQGGFCLETLRPHCIM